MRSWTWHSLSEQEAAYLTLLFAPDRAGSADGTVEQILAASENFAADLGKRLRKRVYEDVVPTAGGRGRRTDGRAD